MKVFYLDSFFVLNLIIDYLLLLLTAKVTGVPTKRSALFFGALLGTVFALGMFFFSGGLLITFFLNCAAGWIMISVSFSPVSARKRLRLCGILLVQAFGFSGGMSLLQTMGVGRITVQNGATYIQIELWQIIFSALGAYVMFRFCFKDHSLKLEKQRVPLEVLLGEKKLRTLVLTDSGNLLREPLSGKSVILLAPEIVVKLLPEEAALLLKNKDWDVAAVMSLLVEKNIVARLIPFSTIGEKKGLTLAVKPDDITVEFENGRKETTDYWIGIARNDIDICGGCRGLIGV